MHHDLLGLFWAATVPCYRDGVKRKSDKWHLTFGPLCTTVHYISNRLPQQVY